MYNRMFELPIILSSYLVGVPFKKKKKNLFRDFPGSPVVKTSRSQCRWVQVQSLVRELRSCMLYIVPPQKNILSVLPDKCSYPNFPLISVHWNFSDFLKVPSPQLIWRQSHVRPYRLACLPLEGGHYNRHGPFQNAFFQSGTYTVLELEWECCSGKLVFSKGLESPRAPQETGQLSATGGNAGCSIWDPAPWLNFVSRPVPFFAIWVEHGVVFCLLNFIPFEHLRVFVPLPLPE